MDTDWKITITGLVALFIVVRLFVSVEKGIDSWRAVEVARLRCAPSAAPAGSAP